MERNTRPTVRTVLANLQSLRIQNGYTYKEIADKLCIPVKKLKGIETGYQIMSLDQLFHLANIYSVPVDSLISDNYAARPVSLPIAS